MNTIKINNVGQLMTELNKFDEKMFVSIFNQELGYMSVAFKKEQSIKDEKVFQWLDFYAHDTIPMYDIKTLKGYLSKLPQQATVTKKTEENNYSSLYLSIEVMKESGKSYQWLVISDELEYSRFFQQHQTDVEESTLSKALEKMLSEMKENNSQEIERIHQYLCQQTDDKLFKGILTDGKDIKGALSYCSNKARENSQNHAYAMVEDDTVFEWVKEYFITYELPKKTEKKKTKTKKQAKKEPVKKDEEKGGSEQQIELFAMA